MRYLVLYPTDMVVLPHPENGLNASFMPPTPMPPVLKSYMKRHMVICECRCVLSLQGNIGMRMAGMPVVQWYSSAVAKRRDFSSQAGAVPDDDMGPHPMPHTRTRGS